MSLFLCNFSVFSSFSLHIFSFHLFLFLSFFIQYCNYFILISSLSIRLFILSLLFCFFLCSFYLIRYLFSLSIFANSPFLDPFFISFFFLLFLFFLYFLSFIFFSFPSCGNSKKLLRNMTFSSSGKVKIKLGSYIFCRGELTNIGNIKKERNAETEIMWLMHKVE